MLIKHWTYSSFVRSSPTTPNPFLSHASSAADGIEMLGPLATLGALVSLEPLVPLASLVPSLAELVELALLEACAMESVAKAGTVYAAVANRPIRPSALRRVITCSEVSDFFIFLIPCLVHGGESMRPVKTHCAIRPSTSLHRMSAYCQVGGAHPAGARCESLCALQSFGFEGF